MYLEGKQIHGQNSLSGFILVLTIDDFDAFNPLPFPPQLSSSARLPVQI